jgi:peptidoglycan hydrolase-like protein with peptidoglycan-binding domain
MPIITVQLKPGNTGTNVRELHNQLRFIGAVIAPGEKDTANFGPSTVAAVRAFRDQYGLPAGDIVDQSTARLMHVASPGRLTRLPDAAQNDCYLALRLFLGVGHCRRAMLLRIKALHSR